ncbi:putative ATPase [Myroides gitamensis]|uniref:AAA family ATPase n=1 Tax=Myroides odoratus TaxID=256 RepID=UPI0021673448|nr:AAA family ATPase [Myroides odoratus]MCS4239299.1 putative ATPase [Myroides odoratus]MDH6602320.1 putative ATPase [Myroides gitamensis]
MENMEKIAIRNFAGIEKLDLDIKPINILIGPQGVGKSVVVKLLYFFKETLYNLGSRQGIVVMETLENHERNMIVSFRKMFDRSAWKSGSKFEISYSSINGLTFVVKGDEKGEIRIVLPEEYTAILNEIILVNKQYSPLKARELGISEFLKQRNEIETFLRLKLSEKFNEKLVEQVFIPAGRSFFSTINRNIYSIVEGKGEIDAGLDSFMLRFGSMYQLLGDFEAMNTLFWESSERSNTFNALVDQVMGGRYVKENDNQAYILHKDQRKVELKNVSSGQQEALPMLLILKAIYEKTWKTEGGVLYIEEPEAHLFPTAQKSIVNLLAKVYTSNPDNFQIFITTHSPYILTSFNNLMYAGNLIKEDESRRSAVEKVVDQDTILDASLFSAYAVQKTGATDLMDKENGIINAELLDEVSNTIGREFDQLLDIEYAGQN